MYAALAHAQLARHLLRREVVPKIPVDVVPFHKVQTARETNLFHPNLAIRRLRLGPDILGHAIVMSTSGPVDQTPDRPILDPPIANVAVDRLPTTPGRREDAPIVTLHPVWVTRVA